MNCDDCQSRICELFDAGQNTRHNSIIEQHLAGCPACREFRNMWAALDAHLIRSVAKASLPTDFKTTLLTGLPALPPRMTPAEIATRRARYEREYREAVGALDRRYFFPDATAILQFLAVAGGWAFVGILLPKAMHAVLFAIEATLSRAAASPGILVCGAIALAAALYGLRREWRPNLRHLLFWPVRWFSPAPHLR